MPLLNETHDPALHSWVPSANDVLTDFPLQNLPLAIFRRRGHDEAWRGGVAVGDRVLDLAAAVQAGVFHGAALAPAQAATGTSLNDLMGMGPAAASALRKALSEALRAGAAQQSLLQDCLVPQSAVEYQLPCRVGDYTDFYTSIHHATNIGRLFRPDQPLMPNYQWVPIGYHGRATSIGVSGQLIRRPRGQVKPPEADTPTVQPSARMDMELELGVLIGQANARGEPIALDHAESHIFGLVLLNDWSARDIQPWEYQPLGPFLAKNFATTVSPWVVTLEALEPFRLPFNRAAEDPQPLPYLASSAHSASGGLDIQLEAWIETAKMRADGVDPARLAHSNYRHAYWSAAQMVTHHTVNGCNLQPGDLLGTGTLSGPAPDQAGALIELTQGGKNPIALPHGETRTWLEDGDTIVLRAWCERPGATRIGFGECRGTLLPAHNM